jgi:hypothetical protein
MQDEVSAEQVDIDAATRWWLASDQLRTAEFGELAKAFAEARYQERERCAKVAERYMSYGISGEVAKNIAQRIRQGSAITERSGG